MTEISPATGLPRLTVLGHGLAGLLAGCTRYIHLNKDFILRHSIQVNYVFRSALIATPIELLKGPLRHLGCILGCDSCFPLQSEVATAITENAQGPTIQRPC